MCRKTLRELNLLREYFIKTQEYFKQQALKKDRDRQMVSMNAYYRRELQRKTGI